LKENQPAILKRTKQLLENKLVEDPEHTCVSSFGDRDEVHSLWSTPVTAENICYAFACQVFVIEREVKPKSNGVKPSKHLHYAITSLEPHPDRPENARKLMNVFRGHWTIENKCHYRRDRSYDEDRSPVRSHNAARILSAYKNMAIFLCEKKVHNPSCKREESLPEFIRSCSINGINKTLSWIINKHPFK